MNKNESSFVIEIDAVISEYNNLRARSREDDLGDSPEEERSYVVNRIATTVDRIVSSSSYYGKKLKELNSAPGWAGFNLQEYMGLVKALRQDIIDGKLKKFEDIIHADMFSDFLEMADYFLEAKFKDPAAVIAGSVLEQNLRTIATSQGIAVSNGDKPKKADTLNAELASAGVISKLQQKQITAWLGLRNHAAHGEYDKYTIEDVRLMSQGIAHFIVQQTA